MKTAVILNPAAGAGRAAGLWENLHERFLAVLGDFELLRTGAAGEATVLAREAVLNGMERVIAFGGDGTWHETAEGYLSLEPDLRGETILGCYPAGSGCDFARHLGFPENPGALLAMLSAGRVRRVDAVRAAVTLPEGARRTVHLTNLAAFGLGGEVAWLVEKTGKGLGGTATYLLATLGLLAFSQARTFSIKLDGKDLPEAKYHGVILANTSTTGGGMKVAPEADCSDGCFEVVTFSDMGKWEMLKRLPLLYAGEHIGKEGVGFYRAKRLEASAGDGRPARLNIDGEACGLLPAEFEMLPGILPVIAP